jgi:hypothetical protein
MLPIGLFIYSFTQYGYLPWIAPTIALAPIAIGIFFIFESTYSFTSDSYEENSSSAIAGQGLMQNRGSCSSLRITVLPKRWQPVCGIDSGDFWDTVEFHPVRGVQVWTRFEREKQAGEESVRWG